MKAVILAGGFGKRLRPLTDSTPKPLITVGGKPILVMQLEWLKSHGIDEVILCIGFLKEKVIEFIGNGRRFGVKVGYVVEEDPLGTGGALLNTEPLLRKEEKFLVLNGDVITDMDPARLEEGLSEYVGAMAIVPFRSPYGIVDLGGDGTVNRFREKPVLHEYWVNAGVYLFSPVLFRYLKDHTDIESVGFPQLSEKGLLRGVRFENCFWKAIDVWKDIEEAERELDQKTAVSGSKPSATRS